MALSGSLPQINLGVQGTGEADYHGLGDDSHLHDYNGFPPGSLCTIRQQLLVLGPGKGILNETGRVAVRLQGERYPTRRQTNHQTFSRLFQNLAESESFSAMIDDTPINSEMDLGALIFIAAMMLKRPVFMNMCVNPCRAVVVHAYIPMEAISSTYCDFLMVTLPPILPNVIMAPQDALYLTSKFVHGIRGHPV
ncbi:hypothetical protein TNCV_179511 [Trichonephila clavipes]|nr:hypothetical protein TNCV_179511 [Trichonephila clavipes]